MGWWARQEVPGSDGEQVATIGEKIVLSASRKRKEGESGDERRTRSRKVGGFREL